MSSTNLPCDLPLRISNRTDYRAFLREDMRAHNVRKWTLGSRHRHPVLYYQRLMRRVEYLQTKTGPIARAMRFWTRYRLQKVGSTLGLTIPPGCCGPGLSIAHYGTVVINKRAKIGRYCRLHPGVTVGIANGGVPTIGDGVYVGPGAVVYGPIEIGRGAVIGANSVVGRSVPSGVTVAGAPARQIATRDSVDLMPSHIKALVCKLIRGAI